MVNLVRREVNETAQTLVVKVGTSVLSNEDDTLNLARLQQLAEEIHMSAKPDVALWSSPAGRSVPESANSD